jgi:ribosome maturation factor RimP
MNAIAHEKLAGLDRDRVLAVVGPVLAAHGVEGVELCWRTDQGGWVLELTIERPGSRVPGEGVTVDLCSDVSRDLSAALDVADAIPHRYRLEVGSPGLDRKLYSPSDYERFAGQLAKLKLSEPLDAQAVLTGTLQGRDDAGDVLVDTDKGVLSVPLGKIKSAQLVFDWDAHKGKPKGGKPANRRASGRGR